MRFEKYLFAIENVPLPVPVTFRQAGIFLISLASVVVLGQLPLIGEFIKAFALVTYIGIPWAATWYLTKTNIDGKPPLMFVYDLISYQFTKGIYNRYEKIETPTEYEYTTPITCRKGEKK